MVTSKDTRLVFAGVSALCLSAIMGCTGMVTGSDGSTGSVTDPTLFTFGNPLLGFMWSDSIVNHLNLFIGGMVGMAAIQKVLIVGGGVGGMSAAMRRPSAKPCVR